MSEQNDLEVVLEPFKITSGLNLSFKPHLDNYHVEVIS